MTTQNLFDQFFTTQGVDPQNPFDVNNRSFNVFEQNQELNNNQGQFFGALQRQNLSPNQNNFFQNNFPDLLQQFQGLLEQQIRAGFQPNLRFGDFANNLDFQRRFQLSPIGQASLQNTARFAPQTQFLLS